MCYHASTPKKYKLETHIKGLKLDISIHENIPQYFHTSGFDHPQLPVQTNLEPHVIQPVIWGLLPHWAKDSKLADQTLNAISEEAFEKPSFKDSILKRRCLIWVDGFFEWQHAGREKNPYYLLMPGHTPFAMGGVWSDWRNPESGIVVRTCSILTTAANELMSTIHNTKRRMPLILERDARDLWFDETATKDDLKQVMIPLPDGKLIARPVSKRITDRNTDANVPEVQAEVPKASLF